MKNSTQSFLTPALAGLVALATISIAGPALAAMVNLKADMTPQGEVPPTTSTGKGSMTGTFDTDSKTLTYSGSYSDLTGPATAAHFHIGDIGKNGGVAVPIFTGDKAGSPFQGKATLTDEQAADLLAGKMYVNVHTATNKGGEIRGQVGK